MRILPRRFNPIVLVLHPQETKGRTLSEIEALFAAKKDVDEEVP